MLSQSRCPTLGLFLLSTVVVACGKSPTPPTSPSPVAQIQLTANPATITPAVCPPSSCGPLTGQLEAATSVTVREPAGVGGNISSVSMILRRSSDNVTLASGTVSPTNGRFAANGSVTIPLGVHYDQAQGASAGTLALTFTGTDDRGNPITATLSVPVNRFA